MVIVAASADGNVTTGSWVNKYFIYLYYTLNNAASNQQPGLYQTRRCAIDRSNSTVCQMTESMRRLLVY